MNINEPAVVRKVKRFDWPALLASNITAMSDERMRPMSRKIALATMLMLMSGCGARELEMTRYGVKEPPSPLTAVKPAASFQQMRLGESVQNRPIEMLIFGEPSGTPVLVLAA